MTTELNAKREKALALAKRNGAVFAGHGNEESWGCYRRVSASTIRALERRGLVKTRISPDGGLMATLVEVTP